jgi:predicted transcriptional regulator YheO
MPTSGDKPAAPHPGLRPYYAVADAMAALMRPLVEAVVHDMASDSVAHVAGAFSPREPGDPSDLKEVEFAPGAEVVGPYEKVNFDGRRIKSVSVVLRERDGAPIGMLCLNADLSAFEGVQRLLQGLLWTGEAPSAAVAAFQDDWHERINRFVAAWTAERSVTLDRLDRTGRRELIAAIDEAGGFEGKRAAAYVARMLGVSRATVYNALATLRAAA